MVLRGFWLSLLEHAWRQRSVVWLAGVRRAGKTFLCQSLPDIDYFDCELPRHRRLMQDPQVFLEGLRGHRIVLDEIHRLKNPSELLKIAADHYPRVRILATGSSTFGATRKFSDALTGRKRDVWLTPMCLRDMEDAGKPDIHRRLLCGGLPPLFLPPHIEEREFQSWMDAYWAKDIQELFRLEKRDSFQKFVELVLAESGGIFKALRFASPCEVSRPTIANYLRIMEATLAAHVVRPFSQRRRSEIVAAPKVYGFDTGFVCYYRGWTELRPEDRGALWEHFVLNEMYARRQLRDVAYWRDKQGHEIDFVLASRRKAPLAIECKWSADSFDPKNLAVFRRRYPDGENVVIAADVTQAFARHYGQLKVRFETLSSFAAEISQSWHSPLFAAQPDLS